MTTRKGRLSINQPIKQSIKRCFSITLPLQIALLKQQHNGLYTSVMVSFVTKVANVSLGISEVVSMMFISSF